MSKQEVVSNAIDAISNLLSVFIPAFAGVPLIVFAVNRVYGIMCPDDIIKRIKKIEKKLMNDKISVDEFKKKLEKFTEHDKYLFLNNLNRILIECIPETLDAYISIFIDMVMKDKSRNKYEELCEIISQLNVNDFNTLSMIKDYLKSGTREKYNQKELEKKEDNLKILEENRKIEEDNKNNVEYKKLTKKRFYDRNIIIGERTVFWKDFMDAFDLETPEMVFLLLFETIDENDNKSIDWAYITKSFIKLERLGIICLDNMSTLGTTNNMNIDRFHISLFGEMLLEYIKKS